MRPAVTDPSSFSDVNEFKSVHWDIEWKIDFVTRTISGVVEISMEALTGSREFRLDTKDLNIEHVTCRREVSSLQEGEVQFMVDTRNSHPSLGTPLVVKFIGDSVPTVGERIAVIIEYSTSPESEALQWLTPAMTSSGKFPFVFSQCQAIHARALLPCQDTCQVKVTYAARIRAPRVLKVLMSAIETTNISIALDDEWAESRFRQKIPIPAYLIAVVCGELTSSQIGPRSRVWAEPDVLDKAIYEFAETEKILSTAEEICGEYVWGTYDLLVLPPSFPYGGMENPCLTFVTPTLLAGDRSQVAVVAHEIAHAWSGNLVGCSTFEDFWLNEGLTVFIEEKILRKMWGPELENLHIQEGWLSLHNEIHSHFSPTHPFTCLCVDLHGGVDPDDAFSSVPYYKGAALFWYLQESVLKSPAKMEDFLKKFFRNFAFKTINSTDFRRFFANEFPEYGHIVDWNLWLRAPGMPNFRPPVDRSYAESAEELADLWIQAASRADAGWPTGFPVKSWVSAKKAVLIRTLKEAGLPKTPRAQEAIAAMDAEYGLLVTNAEIQTSFLTLALSCGSVAAIDPAKNLAITQGRMKYTRPLYRGLLETWGPEPTRAFFLAHQHKYHPICAKMVRRDIGL
jgi:leukotriene-A4 hydrolase